MELHPDITLPPLWFEKSGERLGTLELIEFPLAKTMHPSLPAALTARH
ncbi:hypothetical protein J7I91_09930 [Pseudomonas sp. ISL-84]|nr:hypothetical protein [Pseudomonas sp. ISL-84]